MSPPLTFAKLHRAYLRSSLNPVCYEYTSIFDCLKSAARNGDVGVFQHLHDLWNKLSRDPSTLFRSRDWNRLGTTAYNQGHLTLGGLHLLRRRK